MCSNSNTSSHPYELPKAHFAHWRTRDGCVNSLMIRNDAFANGGDLLWKYSASTRMNLGWSCVHRKRRYGLKAVFVAATLTLDRDLNMISHSRWWRRMSKIDVRMASLCASVEMRRHAAWKAQRLHHWVVLLGQSPMRTSTPPIHSNVIADSHWQAASKSHSFERRTMFVTRTSQCK